jgi:hypothetical protein
VLVAVALGFVARMIVVVASVLATVLVVMHMRGGSVRVLVKMLVNMFVGMSMRMLVTVLLPAMRVRVRVNVRVLMGVQMLVLVFSFHGRPPVHQVFGSFRTPCQIVRPASSFPGWRPTILPTGRFPGQGHTSPFGSFP